MTALLQKRDRSVSVRATEPPNRVRLFGVDWQAYCNVADAFPERKIRVTYDCGEMEIMTVSGLHDRLKSLLVLLVAVMADELQREFACFGSFTHRRKDLERAMEPDSCFYFANLGAVLGKMNIDLHKDPPPDLALEVEISRSLMDRLAILQALGVGEIWRLDEQNLRVLVLGEAGYKEVVSSPTFPEVSMQVVRRFLEIGIARGELAMINEFRKWFRKAKKSKGKK